jgi:Ca-activated chloride channel family protein
MNRNGSQGVWLVGAVVLLFIFIIAGALGVIGGNGDGGNGGGNGGTGGGGTAASPTAVAPENAVRISIASSNTKEKWLHAAVKAFNEASPTDPALQVNGRPVFVDILQETIDGKQVDYRSGTMISDTLSGKIKPTVVSPGEESWIAKLDREYGVANNGAKPIKASANPLVVRTPLVVAMWESRAKALGCWPTPGPDCTWQALRELAVNPDGWRALGHPEWRKFRFGYGYFGESNSGTLGVLAMCLAGLGKTGGLTVADVEPSNGCGQFISDIEKAKVHSGKSDTWLIEKMTTGGPEYLDGVVTYESNVIATNLKSAAELREPLVSVYPQDGTVVVGHPFAILDGTPWVDADQASAATVLRDYLLSTDQQAKLADFGLRPADVAAKPGPPIDASHGANPDATIVPLTVPETLVLDRVGEVWHKVRKHAAIVIVFDKSGSMAGSKITSSIKGAQAFVNKMESADYLRWLPFDNEIYPGAAGPKADIGEELLSEIASTSADGGTALYDAVTLAYNELTQLRATNGDTMRYGIVVLSDGADTSSLASLSQLETALAPAENDPFGIQIHTISIGEDADQGVLQKIAAASNGRFWAPKSDADVVTVYKDIAAHY